MKLNYSKATDWFSANGLLSKKITNFELREAQSEMAKIVQDIITTPGAIGVLEAPTGTGKTLAYLIPAAISERKIIISTATKNLQDQIINKEIPLLKSVGIPVSAELAKGRENYVCLYRLNRIKLDPKTVKYYGTNRLSKIFKWVQTSETGDRVEFDDIPEDSPIWDEISSKSHRCLGTKCPYYEKCFITKLRQRTAKAQIVVVNHHLFFADLILRSENIAQILPSYEAVIFDEATSLEKIATEYFGRKVSSHRFNELLRDAQKAFSPDYMPITMEPAETEPIIESLEKVGIEFFSIIQRSVETEQRAKISDELYNTLAEIASDLKVLLDEFAKEFSKLIKSSALIEPEIRSLVRRALEMKEDFEAIFEPKSNEVAWIEGIKGGALVGSYPVDVAPIVREKLFSSAVSYVFTSATLSVGDDLSYFMERLGIEPHDAVTKILPTCFDLSTQAVLYVAADLPEPDAFNEDPAYFSQACRYIEKIIEISKGRAFVLFTSHKNLRRFANALVPRLKYRTLVQGDAPRENLIKIFREDANAVLFGTQSFWAGVDVVGKALSCVIIDKLPFAPPDDPLVAARAERLKNEGRDPFWELQIPEAVLLLKQGFGRLIRSKTDRGILAILDSRLVHKSYGKVILKSLPPYPVTTDFKKFEMLAKMIFKNV